VGPGGGRSPERVLRVPGAGAGAGAAGAGAADAGAADAGAGDDNGVADAGVPSPRGPAAGGPWWRTGVLYQVYPRSFADSDGDGVGDLTGIVDHLDHLTWLGVGGLWLGPVTVSPNADWGYDVSDYLAVDPALGTAADLDRLIAECGRRGIRVLLDLVPNHTSDRHPWFVDARSSRSSAHRNWYVWADGGTDGSRPNNWVSSFGGPAWTLDEGSGQY